MTQLLQLSGDEAAEQRPLGWRQGSTRALCSPDTGERVWGKGSSPCSWHKKTHCPKLQCSDAGQPEDEAPCEHKPDPPAAPRVTGSLHQLSPEQPCFPGSLPACRHDRGSPHGPGRGQQHEPTAPSLPGGADLARAPSGAGLPPAGTALRAPCPC